MGERSLYEKPVRTRCLAVSGVVEKEPCYVYWMHVSVTSYLTAGHVYVRDGTDGTGSVEAHVYDAIGQPYLFTPPFKCKTGLYVEVGTGITCVTIGYLPVEVVEGKERE